MGTSLTGLTPSTTYDALIKVGDNGPLSATAKVLSDGLGNDSPISMSTTLVGIGKATPDVKLDVSASAVTVARFSSTFGAMGVNFANSGVDFGVIGSGINVTPSGAADDLGIGTSGLNKNIVFATGTSFLERGRFTSDGYLRLATTSGGIQFNGDTAAANALDDYEEGTFTFTATPATSGTITLSTSSARYTKIGRQVFIQAFITVASVSLPVGTAILFEGLPFTIANTTSGGGSSLFVWADANASYVKTGLPGFYLGNQTQIYAPINASLVEANDEFFITMTYTV
jgi:hypothetical protein